MSTTTSRHHNTAKLTLLLHPCCPKSNFTLLSRKIIMLNLFPLTLTEAEPTGEPIFLRGHHHNSLLILLTESRFSFSSGCFGSLNFTHMWSLQLFAVTHSVSVQWWGCLSQFCIWIVSMNKGQKPWWCPAKVDIWERKYHNLGNVSSFECVLCRTDNQHLIISCFYSLKTWCLGPSVVLWKGQGGLTSTRFSSVPLLLPESFCI